jgi:hypothetical protein
MGLPRPPPEASDVVLVGLGLAGQVRSSAPSKLPPKTSRSSNPAERRLPTQKVPIARHASQMGWRVSLGELGSRYRSGRTPDCDEVQNPEAHL